MTTLQTVQQLVASELALDIAMLDPTRPLEDLGIDSLALIECMFKLEDRFAIRFDTNEIKMTSLRDIATMIDQLVADKEGLEVVELGS